MKRILLAHASREGQAERIARHVALGLERRGLAVRLIDVGAGETEAGADDCEGAILVASIHRARFDPRLASFLMRHGATLRKCPSAFLTVSLAAASHDAKDRLALDEIAQGFLHESGWHPDVVLHAAGAIHERELSLTQRYAVHTIVAEKHLALDSSGDTEFTDWLDIDRFVADFAARVTGSTKA
ncbi:MAG: flavodoxin domain-containing protein [Pseudomonadota bacterium]